jgi:hypothetical protein
MMKTIGTIVIVMITGRVPLPPVESGEPAEEGVRVGRCGADARVHHHGEDAGQPERRREDHQAYRQIGDLPPSQRRQCERQIDAGREDQSRPSDKDEGLPVSAQARGRIAGVEVGAGSEGEAQQYDPQSGREQLAEQRREGAGRRRGEVASAAGIEVGGQVRVAQDADDGGYDDDRDRREQPGGGEAHRFATPAGVRDDRLPPAGKPALGRLHPRDRAMRPPEQARIGGDQEHQDDPAQPPRRVGAGREHEGGRGDRDHRAAPDIPVPLPPDHRGGDALRRYPNAELDRRARHHRCDTLEHAI